MQDNLLSVKAGGTVGAQESNRAIAEVQASLLIAKRFPRDEADAERRIMNACARPKLAEVAQYSYSRGGTPIEGPSIRLAEAIAQNWGNISFGTLELERTDSESVMMAYCTDLETNTTSKVVFSVPHIRHTKKGTYKLTDPRDIYENNQNQASRRLRVCILAVIPRSVVEAAVEQCEKTLANRHDVPIADRVQKMLVAFAALGISKDRIEEKLQHNVEATTEKEMVTLQKTYNAIKDGFTSAEEFFGKKSDAGQKTNANELIDNAHKAANASPEEKAAMALDAMEKKGKK